MTVKMCTFRLYYQVSQSELAGGAFDTRAAMSFLFPLLVMPVLRHFCMESSVSAHVPHYETDPTASGTKKPREMHFTPYTYLRPHKNSRFYGYSSTQVTTTVLRLYICSLVLGSGSEAPSGTVSGNIIPGGFS